MADHIQTARYQASGIEAALHGDSRNVQRFDVESDENPTRLLAAASAHTFNTLQAVIEELVELRAEVESMRRRPWNR